MRKCVWLLVLSPWLVQCQLGQSTIRSPTTDAGFIATKEPDSEVVVESSDTDGLSPVGLHFSITCSILAACTVIAAVIWKACRRANKRKQLHAGATTRRGIRTEQPISTTVLRAEKCAPKSTSVTVTPPGPKPSISDSILKTADSTITLANTEASDSERDTCSTPSDKMFIPKGPSRAEGRNSPQHMCHDHEASIFSIPKFHELYNSRTKSEASERDTCSTSTSSLASDHDKKPFLRNSPFRVGERNSSQYTRAHSHECSSTDPEASAFERDSPPSDRKLSFGGSIPSDKLYDSSTNPESSERDSPPSDKKFFFGGSIPSDKLYDSSTNPESSERDSSPSLDSHQYGPCGQSVPSQDSYSMCQNVTEPKLTQAVEIERIQDLALNITASDNDEPGHVEAEEVNESSAANSVMPHDDQESTTIVTIPEVEHFPEVYMCFETTV